MSDSRKKPSWLFWATALFVGLPALYILSFMVACGIAGRCHQYNLDHPVDGLADIPKLPRIYYPVGWAMKHSDEFCETIRTYGNLFMPKQCIALVPSGEKYHAMCGTWEPCRRPVAH